MPASLLSVFRAGLLLLLGAAPIRAAEPPVTAGGIAGTWWADSPAGGYAVSFLPGGEFRFHEFKNVPPFELPPKLMSRGRWRLEGGTVRLTEMNHEDGTEGPPESVGRVERQGDVIALTDLQTGEAMRGRRVAWTPEPIPAGTVRRAYDETVAGAGRIELAPEKPEGRPGERIAVRVALTNTGTQPMFVPLRLADRVELMAEPVSAPAEQRLRPNPIEPPEVPPRLLSVPLAPGATASFAATLVVPPEAGRLRIRAFVFGNARVPAAESVFQVLPVAVR